MTELYLDSSFNTTGELQNDAKNAINSLHEVQKKDFSISERIERIDRTKGLDFLDLLSYLPISCICEDFASIALS